MSKVSNKSEEKNKKTQKGVVVSDAMEKTLVVEVSALKTHPKYKKKVRVTKKYQVHDESGSHKVGEIVFFAQCRPLSKNKRWTVVEMESEK